MLACTSPPAPPLRSASCSGSKGGDSGPHGSGCPGCHESRLEVDKLSARCDHLRSQNSLLNLSLEETKTTTEKLTVLLGKHEANMSAMHLAVGYGDTIIEVLQSKSNGWDGAKILMRQREATMTMLSSRASKQDHS